MLAVGDRCCAEGLYRNALVAHLEYLEFLRASWRVQDYTVPWPRLHQRARQRRLPADAVAIEIDLIDAYDVHHPFGPDSIGIPNGGSEVDLPHGAARARGFWIDDFRRIDMFRKKANAAVDLPQSLFVVLVVGIFAAITVASRPGHQLCHHRPFPRPQEAQLVSQPLETAGRDVVLDSVV